MSEYGLFDVIGPIMIGPSSSHTAGAVKIGRIAYHIFDEKINEVIFYLHGSFAKTYKGHGTDRALLAGVLGMLPSDENIRKSFEIANEKGLKYSFEEADLGEVHPNTVKICLFSDSKKLEVTGSSIGGGKILITNLNSFDVEFSGEYSTLITKHYDVPNIIGKITGIIGENNVNIAFMKVFRHIKGEKARLIIEIDGEMPELVIKKIKQIEEVIDVTYIESLKL